MTLEHKLIACGIGIGLASLLWALLRGDYEELVDNYKPQEDVFI